MIAKRLRALRQQATKGAATTKGIEDYNFYLNNTVTDISDAGDLIIGGNSLSAGTEGYADQTTADFNLQDAATSRRDAIEIGAITP